MKPCPKVDVNKPLIELAQERASKIELRPEFYVGSAKMTAYWFATALGMEVTGYLGPETGHNVVLSTLDWTSTADP